MNTRTNAIESLKRLASVARANINAAIAEGKLSPRDELFYRNEIENFTYSEKGPKVGRTSSQYIVKKTWRSGHLAEINQTLRETEEFHATAEILKDVCPSLKSFEVIANLINFVNQLTHFLLPDSKHEENDIDQLIVEYLDSLSGTLLKFVAEVELTKKLSQNT